MRIIFVRHGEPNYEKDCLTETGKQQAQACAERLKHETIRAVYASSNGRAQETARYSADLRGLPVQTLPWMHEIDWGDPDGKIPLEGHPWTLSLMMAEEEDIALADPCWEKHRYFNGNKCVEYQQMISGKLDELLLQYGYTREGTRYRCEQNASDETILLASHGGSGACALAHLLNLPFPYLCAVMPYDFTSVTILNIPRRPGQFALPQLELFNDCAHIHTQGGPTFGK